MRRHCLSFAFLFLLASCTRMPPSGEEQVAALLESRIDSEIYWARGYADDRIQAYVQQLADQLLTPEAAVQIALLNNPRIQATFENLSIAQADLVEAGLFSNPIFDVDVRYPHEKNLSTNIEYFVATSFLDIFLIPLRTKLASIELEQAKLKVSNDILTLAFEVRQTYYQLVADIHMLFYTQAQAKLTTIQEDIVFRQLLAGNVGPLDIQQMQAKELEAKLKITQSEAEIIRLKEKLNRLLGFRKEVCLTLPEALPEKMDCSNFTLCHLESVALEQRLDIQIARFELERISKQLSLEEGWVYTRLKAGVAGEQETDGTNVLGYGLVGEIPLFNYGQAAKMRLFARLRQTHDHLAALEIQILSEVREAYQLLVNSLKIIQNYQDDILPLQHRILDSSEALYNVMGLGIDKLLENKQQEMETYRQYLESVKNYWMARVQLDQALGGYLFLLLEDGREEAVE